MKPSVQARSASQAPVVQPSWLDDAWEGIKEAAGTGWDFLTGGGEEEEKGATPKIVELEAPDPALHFEVTDPLALIRTPPPGLHKKGKSHVIPQGSLVHVLTAVQKGNRQHVQVQDVLDTDPLGWTLASNIAGLSLKPKPGPSPVPGSGPTPGATDDEDLEEELRKIDELEVKFEEKSAEDKEKIEKIQELAQDRDMSKHGVTPEQWFAGLYPGATFLGIPIKGQNQFRRKKLGGVHKELYDRLKRAEQILMAETGKDETGTAKELGLRTVGGLRPGTGSLHTFGLAVDVNADRSNPWLRKSSQTPIARATQLISDGAFDVLADPAREKGTKRERRAKQAKQMYDKLRSVSAALEIYFKFRTSTSVELEDGQVLNLEELAKRYEASTGEAKTVDEWQQQIEDDYEALKKGNYSKRRDPGDSEGTLDLDERFVMAMTKAGLTWGGTFGGQGKDIMHFDLRDGTIKAPRPSKTA